MKEKKEFTLLGMVTVVGIIALLLSITIPRFQKTNWSAEILTYNVDVKMLKNTAILYLNDHPEAGTAVVSQLKEYIEEDLPKPVRFLEEKSLAVEYDKATGAIEAIPGEVEEDK